MIESRTIPLNDLAPNTGQIPGVPRNPRIIRDERFAKLVRSLKEDPEMLELRELLVYEHDGAFVVLGGNMRLKALKHLGEKEAPCKVIPAGWPAQKLRAIVTKDNVAYGDFDWEAIVEEWDKGELDEWGLEFPAITKAKKGLTDPDDVPEAPKVPVTRPGDIWRLGDHRIICGDSTQAHVVSALLVGADPHLMVTDPPYGVNYDPSWRNGHVDEETGEVKGAIGRGPRALGKVLNDDRADWREAWALFPGDVAYVWHGGLAAHLVAESLVASGFVLRSQIIWNKVSLVPGRGNYHWKHEPCWYAVREGKTGHYVGDRKQSTVWDVSHRKSKTGHGTQKPVECMLRPVMNNSKEGDLVYEPFSGSGTTIIACEQSGRKCRAIELAPEYVDVAVKRWREFTGKEAILEGTGETFAQRAEAQVATV